MGTLYPSKSSIASEDNSLPKLYFTNIFGFYYNKHKLKYSVTPTPSSIQFAWFEYLQAVKYFIFSWRCCHFEIFTAYFASFSITAK